MGLSDEIKDNAKKVHTTEMKMSIGEIISMYKENEIIIRPEFQRLFRWNTEQKSRFIESILIGIPIPTLFVQQIDDGRWEVIDGLQRISTILEFVGILLDADEKLYPRLVLMKTKFLPSLDNVTYEDFKNNTNQEDSELSFDMETKLIFKRTALSIQIVKRESDSTTKYELFDRLNSGGTPLSGQEIRNAIFLLEQPEAILFIKKLSKNEDFIDIIALSDRLNKNAYNEELVIRFFVYITNPKKAATSSSVKSFLDEYLRVDFKIEQQEELEEKFINFFKTLNEHLDYTVFRRKNKKGVLSSFKISKFEALIIGLADNISNISTNPECFKEKISNVEKEQWFKESSKQGSTTRNRIESFMKNAPKYFKCKL
jgi:uncharacterized protein with ParB-like and HNH nuclease domain